MSKISKKLVMPYHLRNKGTELAKKFEEMFLEQEKTYPSPTLLRKLSDEVFDLVEEVHQLSMHPNGWMIQKCYDIRADIEKQSDILREERRNRVSNSTRGQDALATRSNLYIELDRADAIVKRYAKKNKLRYHAFYVIEATFRDPDCKHNALLFTALVSGCAYFAGQYSRSTVVRVRSKTIRNYDLYYKHASLMIDSGQSLLTPQEIDIIEKSMEITVKHIVMHSYKPCTPIHKHRMIRWCNKFLNKGAPVIIGDMGGAFDDETDAMAFKLVCGR